jgi:hypothetical protein
MIASLLPPTEPSASPLDSSRSPCITLEKVEDS